MGFLGILEVPENMTQANRSIRSQVSVETTFRIGGGLCFIAGGILAVISVWQPTLPGKIPTAELGLAVFALGFVSNGGAAYIAGRVRRAGLSLLAAAVFVLLAIEPYDMGIASATALFLIGIFLLADSIAKGGLDEFLLG